MVGFLLRIYFIGLVAFVPDPGGQKMTVLLVDARHRYIASDDQEVPAHYPLLLARAQECAGDCTGQESALADIIYSEALSPGERLDNLHRALEGGGGWELDLSELRIIPPDSVQTSFYPPLQIVGANGGAEGGTGLPLPAGSSSAEEFDYVADLSELAGRSFVVDPVLLDRPEKGRTVGLLRLASGTVKAQRLSGFTDEIVEFRFATASELEAGIDLGMPARALADRVVVEIPIAGSSVRLEERNVATGARRTMDLTPAGGVLEVAIVNLPKHGFQMGDGHLQHETSTSAPIIDRHFELYYELAQSPPPRNRRPVPGYVNGNRTPRSTLAPDSFLAALGLAPDRGIWSQPQCVVAALSTQ